MSMIAATNAVAVAAMAGCMWRRRGSIHSSTTTTTTSDGSMRSLGKWPDGCSTLWWVVID